MDDKVFEVLRREYKYVVNADKALEFQKQCDSVLKRDLHSHTAGYIVRSLYFDTIVNRDAYDKIDGSFERQKLRLRVYGEEMENPKLELKMKKGEYQRKISVSLSRQQAEAVAKGEFSVILDTETEQAAEIYAAACMGYRPAAIIEYRRIAYLGSCPDTRITLDKDIRSNETTLDLFDKDAPMHPVLDVSRPPDTVIETKFAGDLEEYIRHIVASCGVSRYTFGKYAQGRSLLHYL
jgi:VTC domain.